MSCSAARSSRASRAASAPSEGARMAAISTRRAPTLRETPNLASLVRGDIVSSAKCGAIVSSATEALLDVRHLELIDQLLDLAIHHAGEIVRRVADAVIGDAALRIVVGSDLGRPVAGAHLR